MFRRPVIALFGLLASLAANAQETAPKGDPKSGRVFALNHCDACHLVTADQPIKPLVQGAAPRFQDIANRPDTTARSLTAFLTQAHPLGSMPPNPELTPAQVADLASYILSLRGRR